MIQESYVSFEIAKLLKETGFDEPCQFLYFSKYKQEGDFVGNFNARKNSEINEKSYSAPTLQMAMKWLREVHDKIIEICADRSHDFKNIVYRPAVYDKKDLDCLWESDGYKSYEEAVKEALKYSLENLI